MYSSTSAFPSMCGTANFPPDTTKAEGREDHTKCSSVVIRAAALAMVLALEHFTAYSGPYHLCDAAYDMGVRLCGSSAVFAIAKILSVRQEPDEEETVAGSADVESETSWRPRLKMRKGKVESS